MRIPKIEVSCGSCVLVTPPDMRVYLCTFQCISSHVRLHRGCLTKVFRRHVDIIGAGAPDCLFLCILNPNCINIVEISLVILLWSLCQWADGRLQTDVFEFTAMRPVPLVMITSFPPSVCENVCTVQRVSSHPRLHMADDRGLFTKHA